MFRTALIACASMSIAAFAAPALAETSAQDGACEATSFRVYFREGSAELDSTARQMMDVAERQIAACSYAELRVTVDASSPVAAERAQAIAAAAAGRSWDATRIEPRMMSTQRASYGPEYAEVVMTPHASTHEAPAMPGDVGV